MVRISKPVVRKRNLTMEETSSIQNVETTERKERKLMTSGRTARIRVLRRGPLRLSISIKGASSSIEDTPSNSRRRQGSSSHQRSSSRVDGYKYLYLLANTITYGDGRWDN